MAAANRSELRQKAAVCGGIIHQYWWHYRAAWQVLTAEAANVRSKGEAASTLATLWYSTVSCDSESCAKQWQEKQEAAVEWGFISINNTMAASRQWLQLQTKSCVDWRTTISQQQQWTRIGIGTAKGCWSFCGVVFVLHDHDMVAWMKWIAWTKYILQQQP